MMDDSTISRFLTDHGFLTEEQVAVLENVVTETVRARRSRGQMPPYFKVCSNILYDAKDIAERIRENRKVSKATCGLATSDLLSGGAK